MIFISIFGFLAWDFCIIFDKKVGFDDLQMYFRLSSIGFLCNFYQKCRVLMIFRCIFGFLAWLFQQKQGCFHCIQIYFRLSSMAFLAKIGVFPLHLDLFSALQHESLKKTRDPMIFSSVFLLFKWLFYQKLWIRITSPLHLDVFSALQHGGFNKNRMILMVFRCIFGSLAWGF